MPGEVAALLTALLWSITTLLFTAAAERIGAVSLNVIRISIALPLIALLHWALYGAVLFDVTSEQLTYLAASGVCGLVLGDVFYFRAMVMIGPKRAALMMTCWPGIAALIAWLWLGESITHWTIVGMSMTLTGIAIAVLGRRVESATPLSTIGIVFGLVGALGQALGIVLAKKGLAGLEHELSGSMVRMAAAAGGVWILTLIQSTTGAVQGKASVGEALRNKAAMAFAAAGACTGPVLGVWLSLYATNHAKVSIAATLMSTPPILLIPLAFLFRKEKPGLPELFGTLVAVAGVAVMLSQK
jgi:drug/metabolite transporter (DMT)-like permease